MSTVFVVHHAVLPRFHNRFSAQLYPGQEIADRLTKEFERQTGEKLRYTIGRIYQAGALAHYMRDGRPRVLVDGDPKRAPWIDIADLKRHGAIVIWTDFDRKALPPYAMHDREGRRGADAGRSEMALAQGHYRERHRLGDFEAGEVARHAGRKPATRKRDRHLVQRLDHRPTLSKISPISFSLTISGGVTAMELPTIRNMMPSSWKPRSIASKPRLPTASGREASRCRR